MRGCTTGAVILLFATSAFAARDDQPADTAMVCVPAEDGRSWECGTRANPPPERGLTGLPRPSTSAPPPPFLAAPGGRSASPAPAAPPPVSARDAFPAAPPDGARITPAAEAPAAAIAPLPARDVESTASTPADDAAAARTDPPAVAASGRTPVEAPPARASTPPTPPPLLAAPRPRLAPYAPLTPTPTASAAPVAVPATAPIARPTTVEPVAAETVAAEPVAAEPVAAEPVAVAPVVATPVAAPANDTGSPRNQAAAANPAATAPRAPATPPPQPIRTRTDEVLQFSGDDEFLALPSAQFTIQIARASRAGLLYAEFQRLRALGVDGLGERTPYIITIGAGDTQQALLLWAHFPDAAAARAAWDALPTPDGGKPAAYPRRIAPLQDEVRRALSNR